jgi:hypothetical protein
MNSNIGIMIEFTAILELELGETPNEVLLEKYSLNKS